MALTLLIGALLLANGVYLGAYTGPNVLKVLAIIGIGWLLYAWVIRPLTLRLPRVLENFDHLIGFMSLVLVMLLGRGWLWLF